MSVNGATLLLTSHSSFINRFQKNKLESDVEKQIENAVSKARKEWTDQQYQQNSKDVADSIKDLNSQLEVSLSIENDNDNSFIDFFSTQVTKFKHKYCQYSKI